MDEISLKYIPVDFIKAEIRGVQPNLFFENEIFSSPKTIYKGDTLSKTIFEYKNIRIKVFSNGNRIEFSGSLHTLFNDGLHNYNDFSKSRFDEAIKLLYKLFFIKPSNLYIIHLEWGFNIMPPKPSNYILDRCIQHKSVNKTNSIDCSVDGKYIQFKHSQMIFKIYNKALQNKLHKEILRLEIKQTNWSKYRAKGIVTLKDFIHCPKNIFFDELLKQWNSVIMYDIKDSSFNNNYRYQTQTFWDDLRANKSNKAFKYHFDKLEQLNVSQGFNTKNKIPKAIIEKGNELQL
jgi:hypothetical protein